VANANLRQKLYTRWLKPTAMQPPKKVASIATRQRGPVLYGLHKIFLFYLI
jgi:hypothetical protein